jgi:hypothetical protein
MELRFVVCEGGGRPEVCEALPLDHHDGDRRSLAPDGLKFGSNTYISISCSILGFLGGQDKPSCMLCTTSRKRCQMSRIPFVLRTLLNIKAFFVTFEGRRCRNA